ncbi:MAG: sugar ABC transporter [Gammaproteobacteria bacterium]|nr:sugar ABC transporter [Gammaproteobacteria bacterium]
MASDGTDDHSSDLFHQYGYPVLPMLQCLLPLLLLLQLLALPATAATIMVVDSYADDFAWVRNYQRGLREVLRQHQLINIELDTKKIAPAAFAEAADRAFERIRSERPALVILADDNATQLLGKRVADLGLPLVYLGVNGNPRTYDLPLSRQVTGVLERPLFRRAILSLRDFMTPAPTRVLVLFDDSETSNRILSDELSPQRLILLPGMHVDVTQCDSQECWQQAVSSSQQRGYQAIVVGLYQTLRAKGGQPVRDEDVARWTHNHSPLPAFALWDFSVGSDQLIGGLVMSGREQGREAGKRALMLLSGFDVTSLPSTPDQGQLLFSRAALARWKVQLPARIAQHASFIE